MTVANTLAERGSRYGKFADHAQIAQGLQDVMRAHKNWHNLDFDMKQALTVIADKIARILNGDPFYGDNWHDIQGYAKLIEDRINMIPDKDEALFPADTVFMNPRQSVPAGKNLSADEPRKTLLDIIRERDESGWQNTFLLAQHRL